MFSLRMAERFCVATVAGDRWRYPAISVSVLPVANMRTTSISFGDSAVVPPPGSPPVPAISAAIAGERREPRPPDSASRQICLSTGGASFLPTMAATPASLMRVSKPPLVNIVKTTIGVPGLSCLSR